MKQSSKCKKPRRLAQYSSGEDDSGTEEIRLQNHDLKFSKYLPRPLDLKAKKYSSQPVLLQNQYKRTGSSGEPFNAVDPSSFESSSTRKHVVRSALANMRGAAGVKLSVGKPDTRQHPSNVRARLWSEQNNETCLLDDCESGSDSDVPRGTYPFSDLIEQVKSDSGQNNDRIPVFPRLQGTLKNADNSRRVLSDITKETVAEFQYQVPSYFSRDVLPLNAEISDFSDFIRQKNRRSENNYPVKEGCKYSDHASNGVPSRSRPSPVASSIDMSGEFKTTEEKCWFSLHYQKVSMILVGVVLLFFMGLGLMYLNVCFKDTRKTIYEEYGNVYPICDNSNMNLVRCIPENQLATVLSMLQVITPKLMTMAVDSYCNSSTKSTMSDVDVLQYVFEHLKMDSSEVEMNLPNLKFLILLNTHWDVKIVSPREGGEISKVDDLLLHGRFLFKNPLLPLTCQMKLFINSLLCWTSFSGAVVVAAAVGLFTFWHYKRCCELHRQEVYMLVNVIISAVKNHHRRAQLSGMDGVLYLPIEKCKSVIIFPNQLKYESSAWDEAVRFIEEHESRILTHVQNVHGKPTKVWQWQSVSPHRPDAVSNETNSESYETDESPRSPLSSVSSSTGSSNSTPVGNAKYRRNKVWQGQAFETIAGSPNSLPCSPTPCLKIRNMFDPDLEHGDDWPILIQDSILEKCDGVCVLHLHVESSSQEGCVFMKCGSPEEAGKAYRSLHGWWFDTKLVTVKYLRTERYHERYPEAANASCPLRPSNNQQLSLQELWHFPLEST